MNSLPPELISAIIESAAESNALYDSYQSRQRTLSALSLVNRTFHAFAQPLLAQKVYLREEEDVRELLASALRKQAVISFMYLSYGTLPIPYEFHDFCQYSAGFTKLKEMLLMACEGVSLATFTDLPNLTKLCLQDGWLDFDPAKDANFSLSKLVELTLERVVLEVLRSYNFGTSPLVLSQRHFPALRTLGLYYDAGWTLGLAKISPCLLAQLDCLTTNDLSFRNRNSATSLPVLFDVNRFDKAPTLPESRLRVLFPQVPSGIWEYEIDDALAIVQYLLDNSAVLKELYLDITDGNGSARYALEGNVAERIRNMEDLAKEKEVEIIWENRTDDWCEGRVSKKFWRRSKEENKKAKESH